MRLTKRVVALAVVVVLGLSLILVPVVNRVSPTQAAVSWTKYPGELTLDNERYVVDSWVIRDDTAPASERYKMWYTHGSTDMSITDITNVIKGLHLDNLINDIANLDTSQFLNDVDDLAADVGALQGILDGTSTVIGYATSPDGIVWTVQNPQALEGSSSGAWHSVGAPCVIWDATDSKFKMWYTAVKTDLTQATLKTILTNIGNPTPAIRKQAILDLLNSTNAVIGYATSPDGTNWTVQNPQVLAGSGQAVNSVGDPCVIWDATDSKFKMWYTAVKTDFTQADLDAILADIANVGIADVLDTLDSSSTVIGYATSPDGIVWTVQNPQVLAGSGLATDSVADASVIQSGGTYEMWYTKGKTSLTSGNFLSLIDEIIGLKPDINTLWANLKAKSFADFITQDIIPFDLTNIKNILDGSSTVIGYATSGDGINWTPQTAPALIGSGSPWSSVAAPTVVKTTSQYEMWYTEGVDQLAWQDLVDLALGQDLPIGYAYYTPYVPPPPAPTPEELEEMPPEDAAEVVEEMPANEAADLIEEVNTEAAADIIEEVDTEAAADIIEEVVTEKAADIIEEVVIEKAADIIEELEIDKAADIMEEVATDTLNALVGEMSEESLTETLPEVSVDTLHSVDVETLFEALPNAPTEQLTGEEPPEPPEELASPVVRYTTPTGAQYVAVRTEAGEWAVVMGTPMPVEKLMIKTNKALTNVETTLEVSDELPEDVTVGLSAEQIVHSYLDISFANATPEDIDLGHMTFKVEKEWLEENSIHKWSVTLSYYDPELEQWIALPTKRVEEDDTYVYYTVIITHFSKYAISGSQTLPPRYFEVVNLTIDPAEAKPGEDITISGNVTNLSGTAGTFAVTLWIDNTVEAGKNISLGIDETKTVSFTVTRNTQGTYEVRFDRLFGSFSVTKPLPPTVPAKPAAFTTSELTISPAEVSIGETVTISALVANTGDLRGTYELTLKIDGVEVETKEVTLAGGASQTVTFTTSKDTAGTYSVSVNGLSGTFTVTKAVAPAPAAFTVSELAISPTEVSIGETVTISALVANTGDLRGTYELTLKIDGVEIETKEVTLAGGASQTVTFTTSKDTAGTYSVSVNGLSGTFTVTKAAAPPFNWWLVIGPVIGVIVIIGIVVGLIIRRRRL